MLDVPIREIERVGDLTTETRLGIKSSRKAFRTISTILYKDRIKAIIRELSCNAYDAHVDAGYSDRPFDVHLPGPLEPSFWVRDYGKGLSPEEMETIYCTYFESTKEQSSEMIGTLGLGSKSPLCYTDSFTVTSYHGGKRYHYVIFFDEEDMPAIKMLTQEPSNSATGLEVKIALANENDARVFALKAIEVFSVFKVKPNVSGHEAYVEPAPEVLLHGKNWRFVTTDHTGSQPLRRVRSLAIMGQVGYPIETDAIVGCSGEARSVFSRKEFEIEFPNKSLTFMAGRDDLSYDKETSRILTEIGNEVAADFEPAISRKIDLCPNDFEARYMGNAIDIYLQRGERSHIYRGQQITPWYSLDALGLPNCRRMYRYRGRSRLSVTTESRLMVGANCIYLLDDTPSGISQNRIGRYLKDNYGHILQIFHVPTPEMRETVVTGLPHVPFKTPDDLKLLAKLPSNSGGSYKPRPLLLDVSIAALKRGEWPKHVWQKCPAPTSGIYVIRRDSNVVAPWAKDPEFLKFAWNANLIKTDDRIYGINKTSLDKLLKSDDAHLWTELTDVITTRAKMALAAYGSVSNISNSELDKLKSNHEEFRSDAFVTRLLSSAKVLEPSHSLRVFCSEYSTVRYGESDAFSEVCMKLGVIQPRKETEGLREQWWRLKGKYPLLLAFRADNSNYAVKPQHVRNYIDMCDMEKPQ